MMIEPNDTTDVAQLVLRYTTATTTRYLLAKRVEDGYWEFIGGKRKTTESIREAAYRELEEELSGVSEAEVEIEAVADPYPSSVSDRFSLYPVLMEIPYNIAMNIDSETLSDEHADFEWVALKEFHSFETLGQRPALEQLGVVSSRTVQEDD